MKIIILRRYCLANIFFCAAMWIGFFVSFTNFFDDKTEIISSIVGTVCLFGLGSFWLWMILRNYLQFFSFKKRGIYSNIGFKKYLHFDYNNIKGIKVVTFECPPTYENGAKIRGVDSILLAPKKTSAKWIVITDGREDDNLCNYNSYLVPIRSHMVIKFEYSQKREKMLINYLKCNIEYQTVSVEEMTKYTSKNKTL